VRCTCERIKFYSKARGPVIIFAAFPSDPTENSYCTAVALRDVVQLLRSRLMKPARPYRFFATLAVGIVGLVLLVLYGTAAIFPGIAPSKYVAQSESAPVNTPERAGPRLFPTGDVFDPPPGTRAAGSAYSTYPFGIIADNIRRRAEDGQDRAPLQPANDLVALSMSPSFPTDAESHVQVLAEKAYSPPRIEAEPDVGAAAEESPRPGPTSAQTALNDVTASTVQGVSDKEIRFGIVAPFSGSARELGRQMKLGIETAFNMANESGGVHGRQLRLFSADDGYEPSRTGDAMKQLTDGDHIFGIIGNVGTPTAAVALPFALEHRMLFFGAFTGTNLLRAVPPDHYVFNYRPSYAEETEAAVRYLIRVRGLQPREIAVFAQQDSYGDAGFDGVARTIRNLRGGSGEPILRLNYKRNTVDVTDAVNQLRQRKSPVKAIVMVATYRAAASFIEKTRDRYPKMIYTNVSFVGSTALADELLLQGAKYADGVIVTQVVPAVNGYSKAVLDYKAALAKYFPGENADYVSFEGYIVGKMLVEGLKRVGPQVDTERLIETLESIHDLDLGLGTVLSFSSSEHQASHKVWGTQLDETGHFKAVDVD
jgi:ABC-type branched-subunit amino acid transport system substrate-binding protein